MAFRPPTQAENDDRYARLAVANVFTTGPQTIQTGAAGNRALLIQLVAGQAADAIRVENEVAARTFEVDSDGDIRSNRDIVAREGGAGQVSIGAQGPGSEAAINLGLTGVATIYRGAASQARCDQAFRHGGTTAGFLNIGPPIARPDVSGSRGGNAALADLLTELAALGLITDSTVV